jgi:C1A family cysteine protease
VGSNCYSVNLRCDTSKIYNPILKVPSYYSKYHADEASLFDSWDKVFSTVIAPGDQFFSYKNGLFTGSTTYEYNSIHSLHAVAFAGYGRCKDCNSAYLKCDDSGQYYWILRNSWGSNWGIGGWMFIKRTPGNRGFGPDDIPKYGHGWPNVSQ